MGAFLLYEAISKLLAFEHPTIGTVELLGQPIWLGWLMLPALVWSAVPAALLGHAKLPLATALHDKVLHADATMNKADWLTATAAMLGVVGIGFGLWWADAAAAAVISLDILHDGYGNLRTVVSDLMDSRPTTVDHGGRDALPARIERQLRELDWIADVEVRMREEGHVFFGEAFVVPRDEHELPRKIERAVAAALASDWRMHDLVIMPVTDLHTEPSERGQRAYKTSP
jgi:divalent metal cation (Fe/Co/Zn/Cd) transporter